MTDIPSNRRDVLRATAGFAGAWLLGVLGISPARAAEMGKVAGRSEKPLKGRLLQYRSAGELVRSGQASGRILGQAVQC
jgi:hypothetical protein